MRLLEAIVTANHRALAGDGSAGSNPDEFASSLPLVALTCIDVRLNHLFPGVLGIREEEFIWLRNAGNIIFDPLSSMTRTLALACAIKGGREIAVIGHTDCKVRATSVSELIDRFRALDIDRSQLPDNLVEFFGLFASERQNVISGVGFIRQSPLISPKVPVHGLLVDIATGRLEWIVNGYQVLETALSKNAPAPGATSTPPADPPPLQLDPIPFLKFNVSDRRESTGPKSAASQPDPAKAVRSPTPTPRPPRLPLSPSEGREDR